MNNPTKKTKDFMFKQFTIKGGFSGMPVSTDGVLLGAWANVQQAKSILDIGTGTGLLSLMCAQRNAVATIDAIDIDKYAIDAANENVQNSPWCSRIHLHHGDVLGYSLPAPFETIVCNPPYFNDGEQAKVSQRAVARHTDQLSHKELLERCFHLLSNHGNANFILPVVEGRQFIESAKKSGWHLKSLCEVKPTSLKDVSRLLIELSKQPCTAEVEVLTIKGTSGYSPEFIALTKDFYLKM